MRELLTLERSMGDSLSDISPISEKGEGGGRVGHDTQQRCLEVFSPISPPANVSTASELR